MYRNLERYPNPTVEETLENMGCQKRQDKKFMKNDDSEQRGIKFRYFSEKCEEVLG